MRKEWDIIGDIALGIGGIAFIIFPITSYPVFFILGVFLVVISIIGIFVDVKIVEKRIEMPSWWKLNLPIVLGILLLNSGTIFSTNSSGSYPSDGFHITLTSMGATLWILAFGYNVWNKYSFSIKNNHDNKTK